MYYTTRVRAQIINHVNSSFDSYLVNGQMARNKVRVKGLEILRAVSLLSTDIFVYTQFGDTQKWLIENRNPRKPTPVRVFNINYNPPTPTLNSSQYQVSELSTPIQCSDRKYLYTLSLALGRSFYPTSWSLQIPFNNNPKPLTRVEGPNSIMCYFSPQNHSKEKMLSLCDNIAMVRSQGITIICFSICFLYFFFCYNFYFVFFQPAENIGQSQMKHKIEDEMDATRIELAQKNMKIQSLQYDLYKLQEKYENERRALLKEVEFGREKVALLNQEIRRLKQPEQEDTICMMR